MQLIQDYYNRLSIMYQADAVQLLHVKWVHHIKNTPAGSAGIGGWLASILDEELDQNGQTLSETIEHGLVHRLQDTVEILAWRIVVTQELNESTVQNWSIEEHASSLWDTCELIWGTNQPDRTQVTVSRVMMLMQKVVLKQIRADKNKS